MSEWSEFTAYQGLIADAKREERKNIAEQAMHSNRLEGLESSVEHKENIERWVNGEVTIDELIEQTLARYRKGENK